MNVMHESRQHQTIASPRPRRNRWSLALRLSISVGLVGYLLTDLHWPNVLEALRELRMQPWLVALGVYISSQIISARRWAGLARAVQLHASDGRFLRLYFEGMFFSLCLPTSIGGDVVKAYRLAPSMGQRVLSGCTVLVDRLTGLSALLSLAVVALFVQWIRPEPWLTAVVAVAVWGTALVAARVGFAALRRWSDRFAEEGVLGKVLQRLRPFHDKPAVIRTALHWSLIIQVANVLTVAWLGQSIGLQLPLQVYFIAVPVVALMTALPLSINGLGIREGGLAVVLGSFGVSNEMGVTLGLMWFVVVMLSGLVGGLTYLLQPVWQRIGRRWSVARQPSALHAGRHCKKIHPAIGTGNRLPRPLPEVIVFPSTNPAATDVSTPGISTRTHVASDRDTLPVVGSSTVGTIAQTLSLRGFHETSDDGQLQDNAGIDSEQSNQNASTRTWAWNRWRQGSTPSSRIARKSMYLSVVIPVYNERENLQTLYATLSDVLESLGKPCEIIFVDDGSCDGSSELLKKLAARDHAVKVVELRRNFGQTAAMNAGIQLATGEVIAMLDADMQNDPTDIPMMLKKLDEGYELVHGWRKNRQDAWLSRKLPSKIANWLISKVTGFPVHDLGCTLKVVRREIAQEVQLYGEMHRFIPILCHWRGARCAEVITRHHPRRFGTSKYGISRTFRVILDLITVKYMIGYLASPMRLFGTIGMICLALGGVSGMATLTMKLWQGADVTGNPLFLFTAFFAIVAIQFFVLGMLGEVNVRTYYESQKSQPYGIRELVNFDAATVRSHEEQDHSRAA